MYSSVHSASSHTGSVQITISFQKWGLLGCDISEFMFHPIADDPISSTGSGF